MTGSSNDIAVLGARGFLGRRIVPALERAGHHVLALDRDDRWLEDDGSFTPDVAGVRAIVYLVSRINPRIAADDPEKVEIDLSTLRVFVEALHRSPRDRLVVMPSSGGTVYDVSHDPPYREDSPCAPASEYGKAKLVMEQILAREAPDDTTVAIARVSNAYGPGQPAGTGQGVIAHWLDAAVHGREIVLFGAESVTRDFVYVDDVASAIARIVDTPGAPPVVNVGAGAPTSLGELARLVGSVVGPERFRVRHEPARPFDVRHNWLDVGLAHRVLGWSPAVSLEDGIRRTWTSMLQEAGGER